MFAIQQKRIAKVVAYIDWGLSLVSLIALIVCTAYFVVCISMSVTDQECVSRLHLGNQPVGIVATVLAVGLNCLFLQLCTAAEFVKSFEEDAVFTLKKANFWRNFNVVYFATSVAGLVLLKQWILLGINCGIRVLLIFIVCKFIKDMNTPTISRESYTEPATTEGA